MSTQRTRAGLIPAAHQAQRRSRAQVSRSLKTAVIAAAIATLAVVVPPGRAASETRPSPSWISLRPGLLMRAESAGAAVGTDIYVAGGFIDGINTGNQVERYDTVRDRWRLAKPMPVTLNHASAISYDGALYVLGGYTNGFSNPGMSTGGRLDTSDVFLRYDPGTDSWSEMPRMPIARAAAAAAVIGDNLYIAGGRNRLPSYLTSAGLLKRLDIFNFTTARWTRGPDMAIAREHTAGVAAGNELYVLGGRVAFDQLAGAIPTVERYNPTQDRWERVADMPIARNGFGAATVAGRIIVFGGEEPSTPDFRLRQATTETFDPETGRWSRLPDMRTPRGAIAAAAIGRRVYAIDGIATPPTTFGFGSNVVEALDIPRPPSPQPPNAAQGRPSSCSGSLAPRSWLFAPPRSAHRRMVLRGRSNDSRCAPAGARQRASVDVAIARRVGGRCRFGRRHTLGPAQAWRFAHPLRARGASSWQLVIPQQLLPGHYEAGAAARTPPATQSRQIGAT